MPERSQGGSSFENPQAALGGADAVPKTSDIPAHGTEPEQRQHGVTAQVPAGRPSLIMWVVLAVIVAALLFYFVGMR
jgi:hypothetical protein